jgi:hypothetical protein
MTALTTFRLLAPEFAGETDPTVNQFLALAPSFVNLALYTGEAVDIATALKAASLMLARKNSGSGQSSGGELSMEKEGDLQRSYGTSPKMNEGLDLYMQQLRDLNMALGINQYSGALTRMADQVPAL